MSLNRLFWLISMLLILLFLTLAGRIVDSEWAAYQRSTQSIPAIKNLQLALLVEEKLAAERGLTDALLRHARRNAAEVRARLEHARVAGDHSLAELRRAMQAKAVLELAPVAANIKATEDALVATRELVDFLAAQKNAQRDPKVVGATVEMMAATVDAFSPAITALSGVAIQADPLLHDGVDSAQLISSLRNFAGQMLSVLVGPVIAQRPLTPQEIYAFAKLSGQIDQLYAVIELQLRAYRRHPSFENALNKIRNHYFGEGLDILNDVFAIGRESGNYDLSKADIVAWYMPRMAAIPQLRDLIVTEMLREAEFRNKRAGYLMLATLGLCIAALGIFVMLIRVIRTRVLRPILDATDLFISLADDRLATAIPTPRHNDEIGDMMRAIHVLKTHSQDKIFLEKEREEMIARLQILSDTDFLTGLLNRRAFFAQGEQPFGIAQRYQRQLILILMDVDHFKTINDQHGHLAGDRVLCAVAELCRRFRRKVDLLARYGGEEFLLLLPEIGLPQGLAVAEKLRSAIAAHHFQLNDDTVVKVTASFGVVAFDHDKNLESLIERADCALYKAKNGGRNMIVSFSPAPDKASCSSFSERLV